MRTTLTLEDDIADRIKTEARRAGLSFKAVVNRVLRLGLDARRAPAPPPFKVRARPLGLRAGLSYDDVGDLLEQVEGPRHR